MDNYLEQSIYECQSENGTFDWDMFQYLCDIQPDEPEYWDDEAEEDWDYAED